MKYVNVVIASTLSLLILTTSTALGAKSMDMKAKSEKVSQAKKRISKKGGKTSVDPPKTLSRYEKLFDKKNVKTSDGLMKVHNVDGKVYMEFPEKLAGKDMVLSSGVEQVSDMGLGYNGQRVSRPIHVIFTNTDSLVLLNIVSNNVLVNPADSAINRAMGASNMEAVIASMPIIAISPDSAMVFDATDFFLSNNRHIASFSFSFGMMTTIGDFQKSLSSLCAVEAYDNNIAVASDMTYKFKSYAMGFETIGTQSMTARVRTTISLLPEAKAVPRMADYRIGVATTPFTMFSSAEQGSSDKYYANRWRMEPSDVEAHRSGKTVELVKPIVFYVDTLFVPLWRDAIKDGISKWNKAFEKIGFKNAIQVFDYPTRSQDSLFNAANNNYNCVKFAQIPFRNIARQVNTDPRTGEITSASILVFRDTPVTLQRARLTQTAAAEPEVISSKLPDHLLFSALSSGVMREMGLCLGLTTNCAGSSWMPVDSLRSATFTQREGLTSSVTDVVTYNYVAQAGDREKGVKMVVDELGVYDYYAIEWLYKPLYDAKTPQQEVAVLKKLISDKQGDARFRYGAEQKYPYMLDPRNQKEDIGDDAVKSTKYALEGLKYLVNNSAELLKSDETDEIYRELYLDFILLRIYDNAIRVMNNIGGMYVTQTYEGDPNPKYVPIDKKTQRESMNYLLTMLSDLTWLDNKEALKYSGLNPSMSIRAGDVMSNLPLFKMQVVALCASLSNDPYTVSDMLGDICNFVLKDVKQGRIPKHGSMSILHKTIRALIYHSDLPHVIKAKQLANNRGFVSSADVSDMSLYSITKRCYPDEAVDPLVFALSGMEPQGINVGNNTAAGEMSVNYDMPKNISEICYMYLVEVRSGLRTGIARTVDPKLKSKYEYLVLLIDKAMGK